jgi:threonine synthase
VRYDLRNVSLPAPGVRTNRGIWRWRALLPSISDSSIVTLSEGSTAMPVIALNNGNSILLKNETTNPTWSWKDRAMSASVSVARELGFKRMAAISTGNHGVAAAAYSAAANMECTVFCHPDAPELQMALMQFYGARVVRGGRREQTLTRLVQSGGCFPASIYCPRDGCANPFGVEGFKTIAFEIFEELGGRVPDSVFVPTGSGDGFFGIWKGFRELREIGAADRIPRMFLCQAAAMSPYVRAFRAGARRLEAVEPEPTAALSVAEPIGGEHALNALYESGGTAVAASEEEIWDAVRMARSRGFGIEPASAVALSCAIKAAGGEGETRVVVASGAAIKWPDAVIRDFVPPKCEEVV